jgi:hypothetical protein
VVGDRTVAESNGTGPVSGLRAEEGDVRFNAPLLPVVVEIRWRTLGPPRISLRGLMLAVGVVALFFALCAYLGRLNRAIDYHNEQARKAALNAFPYRSLGGQPGPAPALRWHTAMASDYRAIFERLDLIVFLYFMAIVAVCVFALLGRVINLFARRSVVALGHEPTEIPRVG